MSTIEIYNKIFILIKIYVFRGVGGITLDVLGKLSILFAFPYVLLTSIIMTRVIHMLAIHSET